MFRRTLAAMATAAAIAGLHMPGMHKHAAAPSSVSKVRGGRRRRRTRMCGAGTSRFHIAGRASPMRRSHHRKRANARRRRARLRS